MNQREISRLLSKINVSKFRKELSKNIGSQDGFLKEHLKLSDKELLSEYLRIYGREEAIISLISILKEGALEEYLKEKKLSAKDFDIYLAIMEYHNDFE